MSKLNTKNEVSLNVDGIQGEKNKNFIKYAFESGENHDNVDFLFYNEQYAGITQCHFAPCPVQGTG